MVQVSGRQLKAARILLGARQAEIAMRLGISLSTLQRVEGDSPAVSNRTRLQLFGLLTRNGLVFAEDGGVRLGPRP
jgi:transcriptional regulator with XRE-family HTH domain